MRKLTDTTKEEVIKEIEKLVPRVNEGGISYGLLCTTSERMDFEETLKRKGYSFGVSSINEPIMHVDPDYNLYWNRYSIRRRGDENEL